MIDIRLEGTDAIVADFSAYPGRVTIALVWALNRAIASGRTVMVHEIARDTGLKSGDVRKALRLTEATTARPEAALAASLARLPLIQFRATGPEPSRGKGRGVRARLPEPKQYPSAFIATMRSTGHRGVFVRGNKRQVTSGRLPIRQLYGPSIGHVFASYRLLGLATLDKAFRTNFAHELDFAAKQESTGA